MDQVVTPYLLYEDGQAALEFVERAFGFGVVERTTGSAGGLHAELQTDLEGRIYLGSPGGDYRGPGVVGRTAIVYVLVEHVDAHYERAKAAGATITEELVDLPFGHRRYSCLDPQGHEWAFATPV